ncbi:MAG: nucleotidyltransferase domain-containing protein [Planctomycetota bacterium]|jgi:predicted nucleotidyltransferase|nr:nucleotidyltransferase domain-containing protein [Planctomycetota bacterium]
MTDYTWLRQEFSHPHPLLFMTVSGAHLYGFPSPDSDFDLRGVHMLPLPELLGLDVRDETVQKTEIRDGRELDLVTHDAKKFFNLLLKRNGYVLEQLYSPLIVFTTPGHKELKRLASGCITRFHAHHYRGFAKTQWNLFEKEEPRRVKPLLYAYRVLLTGIHLMRSGEVEANLVHLNQDFKLGYIDELIAQKLSGAEHGAIQSGNMEFYKAEYDRLSVLLESESDGSSLPTEVNVRQDMNDFLVSIRLKQQ